MSNEALIFEQDIDFWDEDETSGPEESQEPIAVSFRRLVSIVAAQLNYIAARLDVEQDWPIDQLDKQSLDFLQHLDLHSQQLKEMAELLSHVDAVPQVQDMVEIGTCLESIARLMRDG